MKNSPEQKKRGSIIRQIKAWCGAHWKTATTNIPLSYPVKKTTTPPLYLAPPPKKHLTKTRCPSKWLLTATGLYSTVHVYIRIARKVSHHALRSASDTNECLPASCCRGGQTRRTWRRWKYLSVQCVHQPQTPIASAIHARYITGFTASDHADGWSHNYTQHTPSGEHPRWFVPPRVDAKNAERCVVLCAPPLTAVLEQLKSDFLSQEVCVVSCVSGTAVHRNPPPVRILVYQEYTINTIITRYACIYMIKQKKQAFRPLGAIEMGEKNRLWFLSYVTGARKKKWPSSAAEWDFTSGLEGGGCSRTNQVKIKIQKNGIFFFVLRS